MAVTNPNDYEAKHGGSSAGLGCPLIKIEVYGNPAPQGSKKAMLPRGAKFPVVVESSGDKLKRWRYEVSQAAAAVMTQRDMIMGPVRVSVQFRLLRPKSHYGTGCNAGAVKATAPKQHIQKPDADKLSRAILDSLTGQVYRDDSQVVALVASKEWCDKGPGVTVICEEVF